MKKVIICTRTRTLEEVLQAIHPVEPRHKTATWVIADLAPEKIRAMRGAGFKIWDDAAAHR